MIDCQLELIVSHAILQILVDNSSSPHAWPKTPVLLFRQVEDDKVVDPIFRGDKNIDKQLASMVVTTYLFKMETRVYTLPNHNKTIYCKKLHMYLIQKHPGPGCKKY